MSECITHPVILAKVELEQHVLQVSTTWDLDANTVSDVGLQQHNFILGVLDEMLYTSKRYAQAYGMLIDTAITRIPQCPNDSCVGKMQNALYIASRSPADRSAKTIEVQIDVWNRKDGTLRPFCAQHNHSILSVSPSIQQASIYLLSSLRLANELAAHAAIIEYEYLGSSGKRTIGDIKKAVYNISHLSMGPVQLEPTTPLSRDDKKISWRDML